jgi:UDP-3-O-[3-hydroxymyristoyl] glucosamine N-acyltransferase
MQFTATQIAEVIQGTIEGDAQASVNSFGKIEVAISGQLAFLSNPKYEEYLYTTGASVVIVNKSLELKKPVSSTLIRVEDAYSAFAILLDIYQNANSPKLSGIEEGSYIHASAYCAEEVYVAALAYISEGVKIGKGSKIYPGVFLGRNVEVGENSILHPNISVYHQCKIGSNVTIHAGTVIGSDGFGFAPQSDGTFKKIPQIGNVIIEDNVEIGSNTSIDRATFGSTIIKSGVKLDNLLQVAHNVEIGSNTVIAAQTGISGSTKIGKNAMIGGQVGFNGHIVVAEGTKVSAQSGVTKSIKKPNTTVTGNPAGDYHASLRTQVFMKNLPEMAKRIADLEEQIRKLLSK